MCSRATFKRQESVTRVTISDHFCWHPDTRVFSRGQRIDLSPNGTSDLDLLFRMVTGEAPFEVTASGIKQLPPEGTLPYFQCATGGSTGTPKSVRRSQHSWVLSFEVNQARFGFASDDGFAVLGELVHSLALYGVLEAAHIGADIHFLAGMRPDRQRAHIEKYGVSVLYATPTQLRVLCACSGRPLPLRHILCGGGALTAELRAQVLSACPDATLSEFYGASETSFITLADAQTPNGSVGRAYPGVQLRIEAPDPSGCGEVWVNSPYLFESYALGHSADTRWQNGFLTVGEMGHLDPQGYLFLRGRKNRMVTIADQNVFPEEIEAMLLADPLIAHCAVLPVPDGIRGHVLVAVVAGPDDPNWSQQTLKRCRALLGPVKAPRRIHRHPDFPLLPSGKPDILALAHWLETTK